MGPNGLPTQMATPQMPRPVIGANTYNQVARQLQRNDVPSPVVAAAAASLAFPPMLGFPPPPPPPPPVMLPAQVARQSKPNLYYIHLTLNFFLRFILSQKKLYINTFFNVF